MDERIKNFLEELKAGLAGLPEVETLEAADYYEEYIHDALEERESVESILSRLDQPRKIAALIMAETSIRKARSSPGLKNYSRVLKYSRTLITRPFSILLFSIFIFITYSTALLLFLGAVASAATACVILPGAVYEVLRIPAGFTAELIGTAGMGLFAPALCLLTAIGLFKLCRLFIRLSTGLVGRMLDKSGKKLQNAGENAADANIAEENAAGKTGGPSGKRTGLAGVPLKVCLAAMAAGLILSFASGLPVKLFLIFDSKEPVSVTAQKWEYDISDISDIAISTAHSHIRLEKGNTDKITISYEQPDWMEPEIHSANGELSFSESSNGRMPLFSLVTMHENRTDVVLTLPEGFEPRELALVSRGGFIHIDTADFNVDVETYTGSVYINPEIAGSAAIKASTGTGVIRAGGRDVGARIANGLEYKNTAGGGKNIHIETSRGSIFIE